MREGGKVELAERNPEGGGISRLESGVHSRLAISILYFEAGSFLRDEAVARRKRGLSEANLLSLSSSSCHRISLASANLIRCS